MKKYFLVPLLLLFTLIVGADAGEATEGQLGVGVNFKGAQVDWRVSPRWMFEARYQHDSVSDPVRVTSSVFGLRGYRFFRAEKSFFFFSGAEAAAVSAKEDNAANDISGLALGGFLGLGQKMGRHFMFMLDMGPYWVNLQGKNNSVNSSELHFIADAALIFML